MRCGLSCLWAQQSSRATVLLSPAPHAQRRVHSPPSKKPRPLQCEPSAMQQIYAPLPNRGWSDAELVLNNNSAEATNVYSTFFRQGEAHSGAVVTLTGSEVRWMRLSQLIEDHGRSLKGYDGVELSYVGKALGLGAQLTLMRERGGPADVPFSMAREYKSFGQQAVWSAQRGSSDAGAGQRVGGIGQRHPRTIRRFN
jgi:hypothetical protein